MSRNFKVRAHKWDNGNLSFSDVFFQTYEEAMASLDTLEGDAFKILNIQGQVVHEHKRHHHNHHQFY